MSKKLNNVTKHAFSLIELVVVLSLLLIIATLSLSYLSFSHNRIRITLEKLALDFLYLQRCALTIGKKQVLTCDPHHNRYTYHGQNKYLEKGVIFGTIPGALGPPSSPEHLITTPLTFEKYVVVFYPDGKMQSGALYLSDEDHRYSYALTIPVSQVSRIYKYRYYKDRWERI